MKEVIVISIQPTGEMLDYINPLLDVFCKKRGVAGDVSRRVGLALEEVFMYCAGVIEGDGLGGNIDVRFMEDMSGQAIQVEYTGPRGMLEQYFRPSSSRHTFKRTTVEALGMYIAREVLDELIFFVAAEGRNVFELRFGAESGGRNS